MKFPQPVPVREIATKIGATILGDADALAYGINEIHQVAPGDITFVDIPKYFQKSLQSAASIIILNEKVKPPAGKTLLLCADPFAAYDGLVREYRPFIALDRTIHPSARIDPTAIIEPQVVIGPEVVIGPRTYIQANTTIAEYTQIGADVIIQNGALIGTEAFYFKRTAAGYQRWRSGGRVIIEDNVEIGAGCTINKGVSGDTRIGTGSRLDCQVHVGHDVTIGQRCLIAAQVGIGGNTRIGNEVVIYGQAGIAQNLTIGDRATISAKAGVSKDLEGGKLYFGIPAAEGRIAYRELAALRLLPEFFQEYYK